MPLKTFVKVGSITSLSEARYCAGMGVDLLGFRVIPGQDHYVAPSQFQEIRGWVAGPEIVAELYGMTRAEDLDVVLTNYKPDYLEIGPAELELLGELPLPFILSDVAAGNGRAFRQEPTFLLVKELSAKSPYRCLLEVNDYDQVQQVFTSSGFPGIALKGSPEIRPGLKNYDEIADILEKLEVD